MVHFVEMFVVEGLRTVAPHGCHCSSCPRCFAPLCALSGQSAEEECPLVAALSGNYFHLTRVVAEVKLANSLSGSPRSPALSWCLVGLCSSGGFVVGWFHILEVVLLLSVGLAVHGCQCLVRVVLWMGVLGLC